MRTATTAAKFKPGDKVKYSAQFLKSAGMTSDRGRKGVITNDPTGMPAGRGFVSVKWNDEAASQPIQESALMKTSASCKGGAVSVAAVGTNFKKGELWQHKTGNHYFAPLTVLKNGGVKGLRISLLDRNWRRPKWDSVPPGGFGFDQWKPYDTKADPDSVVELFREHNAYASFKGAVPGNLGDNTKPSTPESQQYAVDLLKQGGILPEDQQADDYPVLTAAVKREIIATLLRRKQTKLATWASRNLVTAGVSMQQVSQFRREAASAGDMAAVKIADKALNGNKAALREVEKMIRAAEGSTHRVHADTAYMKSLAPAAKTALKSYGKLKGSGLNFVVEMEDGRYMEFDFQAATRFDPKAGWMLTLKQGSSILGWTGADLTGDKDTDTKTIAQKVKVQMTKWH